MVEKLRSDEIWLKPAVNAVAGTAAIAAMVPGKFMDGQVDIFGTKVPLWAVSMGTLYASGVIGEILHASVYPTNDASDKMNEFKSGAVSLGLNAASNLLMWELLTNGRAAELGMGTFIGSAAVAALASDLGYERFIRPFFK